jgi:hypothetical protein
MNIKINHSANSLHGPEEEEEFQSIDPDGPNFVPEVGMTFEIDKWLTILDPERTIIDARGQIWAWTKVPLFVVPPNLPVCPKIGLAREVAYRASQYNGVSGFGIEKMLSVDPQPLLKRFLREHAYGCVHCCNQLNATLSHYDHVEYDRFQRFTWQWWKQQAVNTVVGFSLLYELEKARDGRRR